MADDKALRNWVEDHLHALLGKSTTTYYASPCGVVHIFVY